MGRRKGGYRILLAAGLLLWGGGRLYAEGAGGELPGGKAARLEEWRGVVGWNLRDVWETGEIPEEVYPLRAEAPEQDDVVFFYDDFHYLYLYGGRVWQVRWDRRAEEACGGIRPGMSEGEIRELWGEPEGQTEDSWLYLVEDRGWPLMLRIVYSRGESGGAEVVDVYLYRGEG